MTAENEVLTDLLDQLARTAQGVIEDLEVLGERPTTVGKFEGMSRVSRSASKALLKGFEQYVDTLQRVIRTELRATGHRLKGMTPFDVALKAEELNQVANAVRYFELIKLRNELTHEYSDDVETRFIRFTGAIEAFPFLDDAADRVRDFARTRLPEA